MVDAVYFVKSILPRAVIGSFQHFVDIYFHLLNLFVFQFVGGIK